MSTSSTTAKAYPEISSLDRRYSSSFNSRPTVVYKTPEMSQNLATDADLERNVYDASTILHSGESFC